MKLFVLLTIDGRTYTISETQKKQIVQLANSGRVKTVEIGDDVVFLSSLSGIPSLDTYQRQMKQKLAAKDLRMCAKCGTILPRMEKCPCKEQPEKYPDILAQARRENPTLAAELDMIAAAKAIPQLTDGR